MARIPKIAFILLSIILSFFISSFLYSHYFDTSAQFNAVALKSDITSLATSVSSIHLEMPHVELFSQKITQTEPTPLPDQNEVPEPTSEPEVTLPEAPPTSTPYIQPTQGPVVVPTNPSYPTTRPGIPTSSPTQEPQPTKAPKPTKTPDEFPIDPSLRRPGNTPDEVFALVAQKTCVPKAVLRTLASIESGGFFKVVDPKWFKLYNSYNWWNSDYTADTKISPAYQRICSGYAYDNGTGLIESDSKYAGSNCHKDGSSGARSYIMGPMQVSELEQSKQGSKVGSLLGIKNVDRRVILDAVGIVGVITNINVRPSNCTNWTAKEMVKAACGYYGSCGFKDHTYYCNTFCRNIKEYGGQDCTSAISFFADDNCWK